MTPWRAIYDTSAILSSMTPAPNRGSIIWHWMESGVVEPIVSDYLIDELVASIAEPRFRLSRDQRTSIITEYLQHALTFDRVPPSGAYCRDPDDIPVLDLAIWQQVDVIISTDPDLLDLDGEFAFRIVNLAGFQAMLTSM
ncbi:MAG: putative toxin-antitoxin system toxin component, PIN family [Chloroflexi bacterium]|nr:putative toxin-antitoxin system toxin component, PIN family [Chloroflexota bacterium]